MTAPFRIWRLLAALFTLVNLVGLGMAVVAGEAIHAGIHVILLCLGVYLMQRLAPRDHSDAPAESPLSRERLEQLQQSIDAVAVEVERIGEAQRFSEKLEQERASTRR
jgi:hypothetical protein